MAEQRGAAIGHRLANGACLGCGVTVADLDTAVAAGSVVTCMEWWEARQDEGLDDDAIQDRVNEAAGLSTAHPKKDPSYVSPPNDTSRRPRWVPE